LAERNLDAEESVVRGGGDSRTAKGCAKVELKRRPVDDAMVNKGKKPDGPDLVEGVPAADLTNQGMISGHVGDEAVLLARVGEAIFALSAKCTHYGGPLGKGVVSGETVRCPWHHACFSLRTGEAIRAPAIDPVARWRTEVLGDRIFVREKLPKVPLARPAMKGKSGPGGNFVIVGGGAAGFAAAERLRREGFGGNLVVLSADDAPPVDRPNLSKDFLAGKALSTLIRKHTCARPRAGMVRGGRNGLPGLRSIRAPQARLNPPYADALCFRHDSGGLSRSARHRP
jgi:nitrite reductase/ring-hydroxylating ferredoxin subunit